MTKESITEFFLYKKNTNISFKKRTQIYAGAVGYISSNEIFSFPTIKIKDPPTFVPNSQRLGGYTQ
jgi:hypothetical protein